MSAPTNAAVSLAIDAPADAVYALVADITRMGQWSPECVKCEWLSGRGEVGSTFRGHNKAGLFRWKTTAKILAADPGREFSFATMNGERLGTRWSYTFAGPAGEPDGPTTVTESFEAIYTPRMIALAERLFLRNRQQQLEDGMRQTLQRIKAAAESRP